MRICPDRRSSAVTATVDGDRRLNDELRLGRANEIFRRIAVFVWVDPDRVSRYIDEYNDRFKGGADLPHFGHVASVYHQRGREASASP
jgi:hypothetical protein